MLISEAVTHLTVYITFAALAMVCWSIAFPSKRIWPAASWNSSSFWVIWVGILFIFFGLLYTAFSDFNTWFFPSDVRYFLGLSIMVLGVLSSFWAIAVMGAQNTLGIQNGFILKSPYKYCRNPQYLGDILILIGAILFVISENFTTPVLLSCIGFWLMPLSGETWLKERYGKPFKNYLIITSRLI